MLLSLDQIVSASETKAKAFGNPRLVPMIQRELLHYDLLATLLATPARNFLTFQGGTALRLCHGSPRLSEDLDFCAGKKFETLRDLDISGYLEGSLNSLYGSNASLKRPKAPSSEDSVHIAKWYAKYDMFPDRPDLGKQRVKIEIASVPAYTSSLLPIEYNYADVARHASELMLYVESLDEILADKLLSFATSPYIRWRDMWDMGYILERNGCQESTFEMLRAKADDYLVPLPRLLERVEYTLQQLPSRVEGEEFANVMQGLLPSEVFSETVLNRDYRDALASSLCSLYVSAKDYVFGFDARPNWPRQHVAVSKADAMFERAKSEASRPVSVPAVKLAAGKQGRLKNEQH